MSDGHLVAVYDTRHPSNQHPIVLFLFKEYCMSDGHLVAVYGTRHPSDQRLLPRFEYWRHCSEHFIRISIKKEKKAFMHACTHSRAHARTHARTHIVIVFEYWRPLDVNFVIRPHGDYWHLLILMSTLFVILFECWRSSNEYWLFSTMNIGVSQKSTLFVSLFQYWHPSSEHSLVSTMNIGGLHMSALLCSYNIDVCQ